jgi:hypothetical protein
MALIATAGASNANSYTTVDFADLYLTGERLGGDAWQSVSPSQKEAALISATRELERESWKGERATTTQALDFPRSGIYNDNAVEYSDSTVPDDVQRACAELAFIRQQESVATDGVSGMDLESFKSVKLGDDAFELRHGAKPKLPKSVYLLLSDFILTTQMRLMKG